MQEITRRRFLALAGGTLVAPFSLRGAEDMPVSFDHMVLGINDLDRGIAFVEERLGVRAAFGGVHPGRGTRNALLSLGAERYLEIIAPDPKQSVQPQFPQLPQLHEPRLIAWAVHTGDIGTLAKKIAGAGLSIQGPTDGSRARPDGKLLRWKSFRLDDDRGGLLPFFIEWSRDSVHPSVDAPSGCHLTRLLAVSREPKELAAVCHRLEIEMAIERGEISQLRAHIGGPKGDYELSS